MKSKAPIAFVGEAPGFQEEAEGEFFVGASGWYLDKGLQSIGHERHEVRITNALLCRPKRNLDPAEWKQALLCCKPRLDKDLRGVTHVLAMGKRAWHAVTPYRDALIPWLGAPQTFEGRTIVPSLHPAFCMRGQRQYLPIIYTFMQRIFDLKEGRNNFSWQPLSYFGGGPDPIRSLERILKRGALLGIDIETAGRDPDTSPITALGLADRYRGVSILWPPERHYPNDRSSASRVRRLCKDILRSDQPKVCHNGSHDIVGLRAAGFAIKNYAHDTLLMHHVAGNLLRHDLGFVSQVEFACDPWKKVFKVTGDCKGLKRFLTARGEELTLYNAKDTAILPRLVPKLLERVQGEYLGMSLYEGYFKRAGIAARMRSRGVEPNRTAILRHRRSLAPKIGKAEKAVERIAKRFVRQKWGPEKKRRPFKVSALNDLRTLFFTSLKQTPTSVTEKTGVGKLDVGSLQALCVSSNVIVREAARQLLIYRKAVKLRGTYLLPLWRAEGDIHPTPKVWGTKTGRWAYTDPSINTVPPSLRDCFQARAGMWIVEADYSQLELRIIALLAHDEEMLSWYARGVDVHQENAKGLFSVESPSSALRVLSKRFVYGVNYGGEAGTIWASLAPEFPALTLSDVVRMMRKWKSQRKAITRWQRDLVSRAQRNDYVEAPLSGRREYFHGQPELTKILNYPIQATGADIIDGALPPTWYSLRQMQSYLLFQVHDSLVAETSNPRECARRMHRWMSKKVTLGNVKCGFPVDFKIARSWGNQKKFAKWEDIPEQLED